MLPLQLWHMMDSILWPKAKARQVLSRMWPMAVFVGAVGVIPLTGWFIPANSTPSDPLIGAGYYVFYAGLLASNLLLIVRSIYYSRSTQGIERTELRVVLLGGAFSVMAVIVLALLSSFFDVPIPVFVSPLVATGFFLAVATVITTHRIFDARHVFLFTLQHLLTLMVAVAVGSVVWMGSRSLFSEWPSLVMSIGAVLLASSWWGAKADKLLLRFPQGAQARNAAYRVAEKEVDENRLIKGFIEIVNGWGGTSHSVLLHAPPGELDFGCEEGIATESLAAELAAMKWVSPERLLRERSTPARRLLERFLAEKRLGALLLCEDPTLQVVVGAGVRASRRPYTHLEILQLQELASIFESALSRSMFVRKAQRAEQLATVGLLGASVAHEIRNPLVSIKTFAQLLPNHYDDARFRDRFSRLIVDEVARIDRLTEQLLDLSAPKEYQQSKVALHDVVRDAVLVIMGRTGSQPVRIETQLEAQPDGVWSDANGLKQVLLNLCFNAVQAHECSFKREQAAIEVRVSTRNVNGRIELAVADNGPGIPTDKRVHMFEPFHSTKSKGFGLGLTICRDILAKLDSTIALDPFVEGEGAIFRVSLPCPPRSSS